MVDKYQSSESEVLLYNGQSECAHKYPAALDMIENKGSVLLFVPCTGHVAAQSNICLTQFMSNYKCAVAT